MDIPKNLPPIIPPKDTKKPDETAPPTPPKPPKPPTPPEPPKPPKPNGRTPLADINVLDLFFADETGPVAPTRAASAPVTAPGVEDVEDIDETEGLKVPKDVDELTEEEAIEQGYTIIKTAEDLAAMANNPSGKYILMNDIDLSGIDWTPIGSNEDPFTGILNGNGKKIKNLTISVDDGAKTENVGFFGVTSNATISNMALENVNIKTPTTYNKGSVGALVGHAENTNIDNVSVTGSVSGHQKVGGLVGSLGTTIPASNSSITNVNVNADVDSAYYAGGLVGYVETFGNGCDLVIENASVGGNISASEKCAGGFIGEAGSTIVTINKSSSSANVTGVDGADRIGGFIGCANGTKIAICNSPFTGKVTADGDFKGENYGYYMNDAHVSIFELSAGLPVDDILMIDGVDGLKPVYNETTGKHEYEITVSTMTGLDKVVAMIRQNPSLAEMIKFNVQFDFETMDGEYSSSVYAQYGVVQHQYEDENGDVVNDVYIDNEIDTESTFHGPDFGDIPPCDMEPIKGELYEKTMIEGLYKDKNGNYFVSTFYGMVPTTLAFFFNNQQTNVKTRLDEDEVEYRNQITMMVQDYQKDLRKMLKDFYNYDGKSNTIIGEPEYEYLKSKKEAGEELSDLEALQFTTYELDMKIIDMVNQVTHNKGCGMGGDSSFLDETTALPLYDEEGRMRFQTMDGTELRQQFNEDKTPKLNDAGEPLYEGLDGEPWEGTETVFTKRGYPKTDEQGRMMYTDEAGASVFKTENEDGTFAYSLEDGTAYEGDTEALKQQLEEYDMTEEFNNLEKQMQDLLKEYEEKYGKK